MCVCVRVYAAVVATFRLSLLVLHETALFEVFLSTVTQRLLLCKNIAVEL